MFEKKVQQFKVIESYLIDTLAKYYIKFPSDHIYNSSNITSHVPLHMMDAALKLINTVDANEKPIMSNGDSNLLFL